MSQIKSLKILYRLVERSLDEVRQEIIRTEAKKLKLLTEIDSIDLGIREEEKLTTQDIESTRTFEAYILACQRRRSEITTSIEVIDKQLEALRDCLREKYAESKKYERVMEVQEEAENQRLSAIETNFLDQIATTKFIREMDRSK